MCVFSQSEQKSPDFQIRETKFYCGERRIQLSVYSLKDQPISQAQVDEILEGDKQSERK
jgi:hypothetical protein